MGLEENTLEWLLEAYSARLPSQPKPAGLELVETVEDIEPHTSYVEAVTNEDSDLPTVLTIWRVCDGVPDGENYRLKGHSTLRIITGRGQNVHLSKRQRMTGKYIPNSVIEDGKLFRFLTIEEVAERVTQQRLESLKSLDGLYLPAHKPYIPGSDIAAMLTAERAGDRQPVRELTPRDMYFAGQ